MTAPQTIRRLANIEAHIETIDGELELIADELGFLDVAIYDPIAEKLTHARECTRRAVLAVRGQLAQLDALEVR